MYSEKVLIGAKINNKYKVIHCDMSDSELMPAFLKEHYSDIDKIKKLLKLGDIISLGKEVDKIEGNTVKPFGECTMARMRDFQEDDCDAIICDSLEDIVRSTFEISDSEIYIFEDNKWQSLEWQPTSLDYQEFRTFFLEI